MIKDINDVMPKVPHMKWGAIFNWRLEDAEIKQLMCKTPFQSDKRWHSVIRDSDNKDNTDIIVDGKVIRRSDDSKLT